MRKITNEDLVQYLYNETSPQKTKAIKATLEIDWTLRETFEQISSAQKQLEEVKLAPREKAIQRILDHAEKAVTQVHSV